MTQRRTSMNTGILMSTTEAALYRLMAWLSPAYPTGAFSYSHGLEYAVEAGLVRDASDLQAWVAAVIGTGAGWIDALLLAAAWRAAAAGDHARLAEIAALAAGWRGRARHRAVPSSPRHAPPGHIRCSTFSPRQERRWPCRSPWARQQGRRQFLSRSRCRPTCRPSPVIWCPPASG